MWKIEIHNAFKIQTQESIKTPLSSSSSESMGVFVVDSSNAGAGDTTNDLSGISAKGSLASLIMLLEASLESLKSIPKKCF